MRGKRPMLTARLNAHYPPLAAAGRASKLSADHVLQHCLVERQIGHDLLQLPVLFLELAQPLHLRRHQAGVLATPIVVSRLVEPGLATDLAHRRAFLCLPQDKGDLRLRELRSLYGPSSYPNHQCRQAGIFQQCSVQKTGSTSSSCIQIILG